MRSSHHEPTDSTPSAPPRWMGACRLECRAARSQFSISSLLRRTCTLLDRCTTKVRLKLLHLLLHELCCFFSSGGLHLDRDDLVCRDLNVSSKAMQSGWWWRGRRCFG